MKTLSHFFAILTVMVFSFAGALRAQDAPPPPPPDQGGDQSGDDQGASFQTFYDQLGDQGTWVQTDDYGYVFQPNVSDPDWAPYTDGHWVYTDDGWTWASDESWGWATYHYGRWANIDGTGWVWVPGYRWAPAWVSWRYGGGYAGWAPLPPETFVGAEYGEGGGVNVGVGFHFGGDVDVNFNIGPGCYNFVRIGDMGEGNYRGHYLDRSRNYTVINNTTNITNINIGRNNGGNGGAGRFRGVNVGGPTLTEVNAHSRTHVQNVQLAEAHQAGRSNLQGNTLAVFAPRVNPNSVHTAKPTQVGQTLSHPTFNRGDSINKPLDVTSRVRGTAPSAAAIQEAQTAEQHAPAKAKIATEKTTIRTPINQPLTQMQPVEQTHRTTNAGGPANVNSVHTEPNVHTEPVTEHSTANSPFTGEPANHSATTTQPDAVKPAQTFHPNNQVAPTQTYHPQTQPQGGQSIHPQTEEKPAQTFHPSNQQAPAQTYHPQSQPQGGQSFHPQTEEKPAQTFHPSNQQAPAQTFHPQSQPQGGQSFHPQTEEKPAQMFHPQQQQQATHEAPPQTHTQSAPAPANHPAPSGGGGGGKPTPGSGNGDNKNQPGH